MSAVAATTVPGTEKHPLRIAMEERDLDAAIATLSPDVEFLSPVATKPFQGLDEVGALLGILMEQFEELHYPEEWTSGDTQIVSIRGRMSGRPINGVELLRHDENGKVRRIEIYIRPLAATFAIARAVGPPMARRRGRLNAVGVWMLSAAGPRFAEVGEAIAERLYRARADR